MVEYRAPNPLDLQRLKAGLGFTDEEMAELASLDGGPQWRKYTGGAEPREVGFHMLFFMASRLALSPTQLRAIGQKMIEIGADADVEALLAPRKMRGG